MHTPLKRCSLRVDTDPTRRALAAALIAFAGVTGAIIVAEAVAILQ